MQITLMQGILLAIMTIIVGLDFFCGSLLRV